MGPIAALVFAAAASLLIGWGLYMAIRKPLKRLMAQYCVDDAAIAFWARFALVMLFLAPLFIAIAFGLPQAEMLSKTALTTVVSRVVTSSLTGAFLAMLGMGIWVGSLVRRYPPREVRTSRSP